MSLNIYRDYEMILDKIEGFFIIDKDEKIVYMNDKLAHLHGYEKGHETYGMKIRDVMPEAINKLYKVLYTGKPQLSEIYYFEGDILVSNGFPIYKNGVLIGACEYDAFSHVEDLTYFLEKIHTMQEQLDFYKKEFGELETAKYSVSDIIGDSESMRSLKGKIYEISKSNSTVLIYGETGTGKELIAHSIHKCSQRCFKKFVTINCATIPETLFESELFGYDGGSFTDAKKDGQKGKAEIADGGTLFLDEVDQLSLSVQPKLLRFLQEKEISKIGSNVDIPVDTRVIAATNKDLYKLVKEGKFREDLFYRLDVIDIGVPPLTDRIEDIPLLVDSFIKKSSDELNVKTDTKTISDEAMGALIEYDWPGNVRELKNLIERAIINSDNDVLSLKDFGDFYLKSISSRQDLFTDHKYDLEEIRNRAERDAIIYAIKYCESKDIKPFKLMNISKQAYYKKIKAHNITSDDIQ